MKWNGIALKACALAVCWSFAMGDVSAEQMMKVRSHAGVVLLRQFSVSANTTIHGVEFRATNVSGGFPEVALLAGSLTTLVGAPRLAARNDLQEGADGTVTCLWDDPVTVGRRGGEYYVAVALPGSGMLDPAIVATPVGVPSGSYLASATEGELIPIAADLAVVLVTSGMGTASAEKAGTDSGHGASRIHTFLEGGRPNPSNLDTMVRFGVGDETHVDLSVYNAAGRRVRILVRERLFAGVHYQPWDGRDAEGMRVPAGIYFMKLRIGLETLTEKFLVMK